MVRLKWKPAGKLNSPERQVVKIGRTKHWKRIFNFTAENHELFFFFLSNRKSGCYDAENVKEAFLYSL